MFEFIGLYYYIKLAICLKNVPFSFYTYLYTISISGTKEKHLSFVSQYAFYQLQCIQPAHEFSVGPNVCMPAGPIWKIRKMATVSLVGHTSSNSPLNGPMHTEVRDHLHITVTLWSSLMIAVYLIFLTVMRKSENYVHISITRLNEVVFIFSLFQLCLYIKVWLTILFFCLVVCIEVNNNKHAPP